MFLAYEVMLEKKIQNKSYFQPSINNQHAWRTSYPFFLFLFLYFSFSKRRESSLTLLNKGQAKVYWNEAVHFVEWWYLACLWGCNFVDGWFSVSVSKLTLSKFVFLDAVILSRKNTLEYHENWATTNSDDSTVFTCNDFFRFG